MVFNATINNILAKLQQSVLVLEETGVQEKTNDVLQVTNKLNSIMLYRLSSTLRHEWD
jgi:hypothetical protein